MSIHPAPETIELGESVVDEVRAIREALDEEAGHDVRRLAEQAREAGERIRREHGLKVAPDQGDHNPDENRDRPALS